MIHDGGYSPFSLDFCMCMCMHTCLKVLSETSGTGKCAYAYHACHPLGGLLVL